MDLMVVLMVVNLLALRLSVHPFPRRPSPHVRLVMSEDRGTGLRQAVW